MSEARKDFGEKKDLTIFDLCFHRIVDVIARGEDRDALTAIKLLAERTDGLPKQAVELSTAPDPTQVALLTALRMTPQERRNYLAKIDEEDARALEAGPPPSADGEPDA